MMDTNDPDLPVHCQLDRKRLASMETKIDLVLKNQADIVAIDGPLSRVRDEVKDVGSLAKAAHRRLDRHDADIQSLTEKQWAIVWKVVGGIGAAGAVATVIARAIGAL